MTSIFKQAASQSRKKSLIKSVLSTRSTLLKILRPVSVHKSGKNRSE